MYTVLSCCHWSNNAWKFRPTFVKISNDLPMGKIPGLFLKKMFLLGNERRQISVDPCTNNDCILNRWLVYGLSLLVCQVALCPDWQGDDSDKVFLSKCASRLSLIHTVTRISAVGQGGSLTLPCVNTQFWTWPRDKRPQMGYTKAKLTIFTTLV